MKNAWLSTYEFDLLKTLPFAYIALIVGIFLIVCRIRHNERLEFLGDAVLELISR